MQVVDTISCVFAGLVALLTVAVSRKVFKGTGMCDNPIILVCVGGITFIAMLELGDGFVSLIMIPWQALGLSVLLMLIMFAVVGSKSGQDAGEDARSRDESVRTDKKMGEREGG